MLSSFSSRAVKATGLALLLSTSAIGGAILVSDLTGTAQAQESQGNGQQGGGGAGGQQGQDNRGGTGAGQGGPGEDSDGRGPQSGGPSSDGGGKPDWAQEGIPEDVELGRLSVARSPDHVLERSLDEALANISPEIVSFYSMSIDEAVTKLSLDWDNVTLYDSPLQSLALFQDALDGTSVLTTLGVENDNDTLLALFLGVASDKTEPVTYNTVLALTVIFDVEMTEEDIASLAADAEAIRIAVLAGHDA